MAYSGRGLFALQKGQALVGSHVLEAEKEQVVVFENRAKPKGRFASAVRACVCVCLLCYLALPFSVCPHCFVSGLAGQHKVLKGTTGRETWQIGDNYT